MRFLTFLCAVLLLCLSVPANEGQGKIPRADRAKIRETRDTMRALHLDLTTYRQVHDEYPAALSALIDSNLREAVPKDAWGRDFTYATEEDDFRLASLGADGKKGGQGADADIVWTAAGEQRELTEDQKAERQRRLEEQRYQATRVLARKRMTVVGGEVIRYRRDNEAWPKALADCKREGEEDSDAAVNACFVDPFGNEFSLRLLPHDNFAVVCWGADGKEGGRGRDGDFVITEREVRAFYNASRDSWGYDPWRSDWRAENLAGDVRRYKERFGRLPEELADLTRGGAGPDGPLPPIRGSIPRDRWDNEYVYIKLSDDEFHIVGLGKDKLEGGLKDNADVIYPVPGKAANERDDWGGGGVVVVPEKPEQDDDEVLYEVAREIMLDIVAKVNAHQKAVGEYPESLAQIAEEFPESTVPLDPWENSFVYALTKEGDEVTGFTLTCYGSDGSEGGSGWAKDIVLNQDSE